MLTAFFRDFLTMVAPDLAQALVPDHLLFLDKESFTDLFDPDRREADLVVQVRLRDHPATLLIHLEHQAQADTALDRRMFRYFARLYDRYNQPIYPIALCSYRRPLRPADRHDVRVAQRTILTFQYQVVQLNQMDWRAYLTTTNPAAIALMARMRIDPADRWRVKAACLRLLAGAPLTGVQRRLIGQFVDVYLPLGPEEEAALAAEVAQLPGTTKEVVMELLTSWERKGRAEGLREGRAEGQRLVVERQLARKFGDVPVALRERLAALPEERIVALAEALLDFTSLAEVEAWLAAAANEHG